MGRLLQNEYLTGFNCVKKSLHKWDYLIIFTPLWGVRRFSFIVRIHSALLAYASLSTHLSRIRCGVPG